MKSHLTPIKLVLSAVAVMLLCSCKNKESNTEKPSNKANMEQTFFVGTYTEGASKGIYKYALKNGFLSKIGLVAEVDNPSFLARSGNYIVAVNELENGSLTSFKIEEDTLIFQNRSASGGAHPCFVNIDESGNVLTANYTGGNIGYLKIINGKLSSLLDIQQYEGKGITDRQHTPHAHSVWFVPNTKNKIITADLGTDNLWFSTLDTINHKIVLDSKLQMQPGAGPRHLSFHPNEKWVYVLNELNATITLLIKEGETYEIASNFPTLPQDFNGFNTCADIHISPDGKFLYASNRGHDSIVIYAIKENGELVVLTHESTRGKTPRNFTLTPDADYLLVANQEGNNIISFKRNKESGLLTFVDEIEAPAPVCLLFE